MKSLKNPKLILIIGLSACFILPLLMVNFSLGTFFDLTNGGGIGNTIGGITAPIVGLIGAYIVYISFMAQNEANKQLSNQNYFNTINNLRIEYQDLFKSISASLPVNQILKSSEVIWIYANHWGPGGDRSIRVQIHRQININLFELFLLLNVYVRKIEKSELSKDDISFFNHMIANWYAINLERSVKDLINNRDYRAENNELHSIMVGFQKDIEKIREARKKVV